MSKVVKFIKLAKNLPTPSYATAHAAGFDFISAQDTVIKPQELKLIPTGNIIKPPNGTFLMIVPRSSTFKKFGLIMPHSVGVSDPDYCGPNDEIFLQFYNLGKKAVNIKEGDRIAQGIFVPFIQAKFKEVKKIKSTSRGGYGSTG